MASTQTKANMASKNFPQQLIEEILPQLPVKSLLRFKAVSNSWNDLISAPSFALEQRQRGPSTTTILASTPSGLSLIAHVSSRLGDEVRRLDFPPNREENNNNIGLLKIMGSCHGVVALALNNDNDFFLLNPLTGNYKQLPHPCPSSQVFTNPSVQVQDNFWSGFGYDPSTNDYKVFVAKSSVDGSSGAITSLGFIFSVRSNSWRQISLPPSAMFVPGDYYYKTMSGCFVNGALHWVRRYLYPQGIMSFDLNKETFGVVAMPVVIRDQANDWCNLGLLNGSLCLSYAPQQSPTEIWVMMTNNTWTKLLTFPSRIPNQLLGSSEPGQQLISINEKKELMRYGFEHDPPQQTVSISEEFKICKCGPETVRYETMSVGNVHCRYRFVENEDRCHAIMCRESLYFPVI